MTYIRGTWDGNVNHARVQCKNAVAVLSIRPSSPVIGNNLSIVWRIEGKLFLSKLFSAIPQYCVYLCMN